jgi:hypothetical protein
MKGHVSYEREPLRGYIYNPHFSFVIISFLYILLNIILFHPKWITLFYPT